MPGSRSSLDKPGTGDCGQLRRFQ